MMVRFSDIIGDKPKKERESPSSEENSRIQELRISDINSTETVKTDSFSELVSDDSGSEGLKLRYKKLFGKALDIRDRIKKNLGIIHSPVLSELHNIINDDLIDVLYDYAISSPGEGELPWHTTCVTLGSMKIGKGLGYNTKSLLELGLGAFFENIGMYKIPDRILEKKERLNPDELAEVRKHPEICFRILGGKEGPLPWLAEVALQIHERSDGSGYPKGLKGEKISEYASIIGIMDTFMAMIKPRAYRDKYLQTNAVKNIIGLEGKFPQKVVKGFLNQISLFPINTYVRLTNNSIGKVISTDKVQPLRPTIALLYDGLGEKLEKREIIHLSKSPLLHIVDTLDEKELS